jgi:putative cell wall-binding protein
MRPIPKIPPRRAPQQTLSVFVATVAIVTGALVGVISPASVPSAQAANLSQFDPGNIISDAVFFDANAMTQVQIQSFVESKETSCSSSAPCLKNYYTTTASIGADAMCGAYSGGGSERASAIIYKVAQACGINPQVLLVTMQKEQGLVTWTWPSTYAYTNAMGADCPDTTGCVGVTAGFFAQVYKSAWQLKRYANPAGTSKFFTWYAPGNTWNILYSPNAACGRKAVYVKNQATADLYYYTPYTPNTAALNAGYGSGDSCSSYGNRNFYNYFTDWFGSTQVPTNVCMPPPDNQIAAAAGEYTVNVASLNARQAPTTDCAAGVISLPQGTIVTKTGEYGSWWRVRLNNQVFWLASAYLTATPPVTYTTTRLAGDDRYATAAAVALKMNPSGAATVYIASGENFPDALSGAALAAQQSAPLLLTNTASLPQQTVSALQALKPSKVVILGGEQVIAPSVVTAIGTVVGSATTVARVAGDTRYATSLAVAQAGWKSAPVVYLATGLGFADALSASAVAAAQNAPVLLVDGSQPALPPDIVAELSALGATRVVIAGGPQAITTGISTQIAALGITVDRRAGVDRYGTSLQLAALAPASTQALLVSGENFPDALTGAAMAGRLKAPMLATSSGCMVGSVKDFLISHNDVNVTLIGGPAALSDTVLSSGRC